MIVLSPRMKEVLFKGEDPLGKYVNAGSVAYQVIGVYKAEDNDNNAPAYIPFSTAQTLYNAGYGLDEIIFTVKGISTRKNLTLSRNVSASRWERGISSTPKTGGRSVCGARSKTS